MWHVLQCSALPLSHRRSSGWMAKLLNFTYEVSILPMKSRPNKDRNVEKNQRAINKRHAQEAQEGTGTAEHLGIPNRIVFEPFFVRSEPKFVDLGSRYLVHLQVNRSVLPSIGPPRALGQTSLSPAFSSAQRVSTNIWKRRIGGMYFRPSAVCPSPAPFCTVVPSCVPSVFDCSVVSGTSLGSVCFN